MRDISLEISRDFAPRRFRAGLGRTATHGFSPRELLGISQQISREFAPRIDSAQSAKPAIGPLNTVSSEPIEGPGRSDADKLDANVAPARMGTGAIVALPVDPEHLHVYWRLDEQAMVFGKVVEQAPTPFTLRVFSQVESVAADTNESSSAWFDVPVDGDSSQQQIVLPVSEAGTTYRYRVAIGRLDEHRQFTALAYSNSAATAPRPIAVGERLSPAMARFIMLPSQASSTLAGNASGQQQPSIR